ncbi:ArnT family glycosyltransferase [Cellulophaga omnivescoria]|uniref:ArnT family glycosyltransferase n=1 Tax=Cellulophaga omnivescoria TaxID=1888890 RepID=UPI000984C81D|nr:glycosyltransferase family 39 protein [Cellulophaga omnivescoria]WKB80920.1 glycosyltransferase family 39 protein [Cellulophaga lytica]
MTDKKTTINYMLIAVLSIVVFRFIITGAIPLLDKTEARYAEISRLMQETGEWVVLQIDYNEPFWAKPPLSTWMSAVSFELFGVNELTARLPSFLLGVAMLFILGYFVKKTKVSPLVPALVLVTTPEFLIHMGVVSTDSALCFSVMLIMLSFWKSISSDKKTIWNYLFFVGLGLGFLAKGPLVLVLTGAPVFFWLLLNRKTFFSNLGKLPWIVGLLITIAIALPWYLLTEQRSPGFIDYFIVGEHFNRFLKPGWSGDLYGQPKTQPLGLIWVFMLSFCLPWFYIVLAKIVKFKKRILDDKYVAFLLFWLFWTPIFFTISKNILHTYILPSTVPMALLIAHWWPEYKHKKKALIACSIFPILVFIAGAGLLVTDQWKVYMNSDKLLVAKSEELKIDKNPPILYLDSKTYSSQFYNKGNVTDTRDKPAKIDSILEAYDKLYILSDKREFYLLPKKYVSKLQVIDTTKKARLYLYNK